MMLFSSGWAFGQVFITEIADPDGLDGARFVELYNAGGSEVDFSTGWQIQRATNGNAYWATAVDLTGTISAGGFYIICANQTTFTTTFGFAADQSIGTGGPADSNGDDQIRLLSPGTVVEDMFGVLGEDGSGTDHEFEDGRAERAASVVAGNVTYTFAEWNIWNDTGSSGTTNDPQDAPADFDPGEWIGEPAGTSPTIALSTTTLSGYTYEFGNGPSAEQSFTVEGSDLTADITLTPPTNYEISTGTGGSFSATNPITLTQSGGAVAETTIYTRLKASLAIGDYNAEDIIASSTGATSKTVTCSGSVYNQIDWANLQSPATGAITRGGDFNVYAQVYEASVTEAAGQGAGITVWIGYGTTNPDPTTWTNWIEATYNVDNFNNDEYMANIGAAIAAPGVYYYASRFQLGSAPYYYGGYNGGAWNGTTNVSGVLTVTGAVSILINEVDADTEGDDSQEFIELYDGGTGSTPLDGLVIVLYNGSDDQSYNPPVFDLDGYSTDANGYFVIGSTGMGTDIENAPGSYGWLQNGADAVALYYGDATDFPNDTPVTIINLIDALVYDTGDGDDAGLLVLLNASEPQVDEAGSGNSAAHSNQRFTNGSGGARNTSSYMQATPTPGAKNIAETEWTGGGVAGDWSDNDNWTNGAPTSDYNIIIPSGTTATLSGSVSCNNLEVEASAEFTIEATGDLNINNPVIVQSDGSGSGSFINNGTVSLRTKKNTALNPTVLTYNRYVADAEWHLLSAPVSGQGINSLLTDAANSIVFADPDYSMKNYDEASDTWSALYTAATSGDMTSGNGYVFTRTGEGTISMSGALAASSATTLTRDGQGWNLLGNPFPSAIAANTTADATNNLLTVNAASLDGDFTALYVWDYSTASYLIVNHVAGSPSSTLAQDYLQAGQGFFVRSKAGGETFNITAAMQSHQPTVAFKSEAEAWPSITLKAKTAYDEATTQMAYHLTMNKGLDVGYDGGLFTANPEFSLYSRLVEDNGTDFMLQALPEEYETLVVPIGLDAKAGEIITFSAQSLNIPEDYAVVIEDRAMNIFTDLSDEAEYAVQLDNVSEGTGRFFVRTSMKSALGIGDVEKGAFQVFTRVNDNQLVIRGEFTVNTVARIYSITGKQIANFNLDQATEQSVSFNEESGVYIVQISNEQGTYTQKFSWVK